MFCAGAIDGEDVVSSMQGTTPEGQGHREAGLEDRATGCPCPASPCFASPVHHARWLDTVDSDSWLVPVGASGERDPQGRSWGLSYFYHQRARTIGHRVWNNGEGKYKDSWKIKVLAVLPSLTLLSFSL